MVEIEHNLDEKKFKWLWAKYVKKGILKGTAQDVLLDLIVRSSQVLQTKNF